MEPVAWDRRYRCTWRRSGWEKLGLVEFDDVDESNLQRQVLYGQSDIGQPKLEVALGRLREINPLIELVGHAERIDATNAMTLLSGYDIVVDGSDNFPTRYLVNDACVLAGKPNVYGSIFRFEGQASVFWGARGPCYRCLFPEPPPPGLVPSCAEGGVLGILPAIIGSLQANEVVKLILEVGKPLIGRLVLFDALQTRFREVGLKKSPECPVCSDEPDPDRAHRLREVLRSRPGWGSDRVGQRDSRKPGELVGGGPGDLVAGCSDSARAPDQPPR